MSDIAELAQSINRKTQAAIEQGAIRLDLLENDSKEASKLIGMICTDMIETMYRNKNSGIYVIFNTSSLDGNVEPKTGFHVRDFDPTVNATTQYSDLLLECAADIHRQGHEYFHRHGLGHAIRLWHGLRRLFPQAVYGGLSGNAKA